MSSKELDVHNETWSPTFNNISSYTLCKSNQYTFCFVGCSPAVPHASPHTLRARSITKYTCFNLLICQVQTKHNNTVVMHVISNLGSCCLELALPCSQLQRFQSAWLGQGFRTEGRMGLKPPEFHSFQVPGATPKDSVKE